MLDCFNIRRVFKRATPGPFPVVNSEFDEAGFTIVMGEQLRRGHGTVGELVFQDLRDPGVYLPAPTLEQAGIGHIPDERMLERVTGIGRGAAAEQQADVDNSGERLPQIRLAERRDGREQFVGELTPERCALLRRFLGRAQPIEPRYQ